MPCNTVFGVLCALVHRPAALPREGSPERVHRPALALSPVVVGLALFLVYARNGWFGPGSTLTGIQVIFALPAMVLATIFVSLPFVVREVVPVLREIGTEQEEAAWTLGASGSATFRRVTLPAIRWGVAYGVVLTTARALGEYGAVTVVSGPDRGKTETLTLHVDNSFQAFDLTAVYTASVVLAVLAVVTLFVDESVPKGDTGWRSRSAA